MRPSEPSTPSESGVEAELTPEPILLPYGDPLTEEKNDSTFRLGFWNCHGFPYDDSSKLDAVANLIRNTQFDNIGLAELNRNWSKIPIYHRPSETLKKWLGPETTTQIAHNQHVKFTSKHVYGGTATITLGRETSRLLASGSDPTGLGRWSWQLLRGKNGRKIRIYSAYCPVLNTGSESVYTQHLTYFDAQQLHDPSPRRLFIQQLQEDITNAQTAGDLIVLGIDANHDLKAPNEFTEMIQRLRLRNPFLELIQKGHGPMPPTRIPGTRVIDSIYISEGLQYKAAGCLGSEMLPNATDHSCLWMDFETLRLFGHKVPTFIPPKAQRLQPGRPDVVTEFQDAVHRIVTLRRVPQRIQKFHRQLPYLTDQERETAWAFIWRDTTYAVEYADKVCRKLRVGAHGFSAEWKQIIQQLDFWKFRIAQLQGRKTSVRSMLRLAKQLQSPHFLQLPLEEAFHHQQDAQTRKRIYKKVSRHKRDAFVETLAQLHAAQHEIPVATALRINRHRERQINDARRIKYVDRSGRRTGLTVVRGPDPSNPATVKEFTTKEGVEGACLRENKARFTQSADNPWLQPPLIDHAGHIGLTPFMEHILQHGSFPPGFDSSHVEPCAHRLLPHFKRDPSIQDISWDYDPPKYAHGWRKINSSTSASPYGWTFAQVKCMTQDPRLCSIPATLAWAPFAYGFSPPQWHPMVNVMLEKERNNVNTNKLRAIGLLDSLYNHNNKRLGSLMLANAEAHGQVAKEQYGSRKGKECIDQSLNKTLTMDFWRVQRMCGAICTTDLKSCYDRLIYSVATLCCRRWGAPVNALKACYQTLARLEYHIRTAFGDSEVFFKYSQGDKYTHGVVQGNGKGPPTYACMSSPIFEMMREEGLGSWIETPITRKILQYLGFSFVDDADKIATGDTATAATASMQHLLDAWADGCRVTGGQLVPDKSHWYLIEVQPTDNGDYRYVQHSTNDHQLFLRDPTGRRVPLQRHLPHEAKKTLGVHFAPDGNQREQKRILIAKSQQWADSMRASSLPRHLVWQAYHTVLLKRLEFVLPTCTLSRSDCEDILRPARQACLQLSGIVPSFPRAVFHGPPELQGLDSPHLFDTQAISRIMKILKYSDSPGSTNQFLLQSCIESQQLELGTGGDMLVVTPRQAEYMTPTWLRAVSLHMTAVGWTIQHNIPPPSTTRRHDIFLMDHFVKEDVPASRLAWLAGCCRYLQVLTLGDILDPSGTVVLHNAWNGISTRTRSTYKWPQQCNLNPAVWKYWRQTLQRLFKVNPNTRACPMFTGPLQEWPHRWWYEPSSGALFHHTPRGWMRHLPLLATRTRSGRQRFHPEGPQVHSRPRTSLPAATYSMNGILHLDGTPTPAHPVKPPATATRNFWDYAESFPRTLTWLFKGRRSLNLAELLTSLLQDQAKAVSDGSYADRVGTASIAFWTGQRTGTITYAVPGLPEDQSSYRSEAAGIYGQIWFWYLFCKYHGIQDKTIPIASDGNSVLTSVFHKPITVNMTDRDLITGCKTGIKQAQEIRITFVPKYVPGHQDRNKWNMLDLDATLNQIADDQAVEYRYFLRMNRYYPKQLPIYGEAWIISINEERAVTHQREKLRISLTWPALDAHWSETRAVSQDLNRTAYDAQGHAIRNLPKDRQRWVAKHMARFGPVGKNMVRRKQWSTNQCPLCSQPEDTRHVWLCPHENQATRRANALNRIDSWMQSYPTDPDIRRSITQRLQEWFQGSLFQPIQGIHPTIQHALEIQDAVGWELPFTGIWDKVWVEQQQEYLTHRRSRRSAKLWLSGLIRHFLELAHDLWLHRNRVLHEKTSQKNQLQLQAAIRYHYATPRHLYPTHVHSRFTDLNRLLQAPLATQQAWLTAIEVYKRHDHKQLDRQRARNRRLLRSLGNQLPLRPTYTRNRSAIPQAVRRARVPRVDS